jgi:hypothetical protein
LASWREIIDHGPDHDAAPHELADHVAHVLIIPAKPIDPAHYEPATAQAQAEATKAAQRSGIEHAKTNDERSYLGRKPSYSRQQFDTVRAMLGHQAFGIAQIAKDTGLTRQTVYRIKADPAGAEAALAAWGL